MYCRNEVMRVSMFSDRSIVDAAIADAISARSPSRRRKGTGRDVVFESGGDKGGAGWRKRAAFTARPPPFLHLFSTLSGLPRGCTEDGGRIAERLVQARSFRCRRNGNELVLGTLQHEILGRCIIGAPQISTSSDIHSSKQNRKCMLGSKN